MEEKRRVISFQEEDFMGIVDLQLDLKGWKAFLASQPPSPPLKWEGQSIN